MQVATSSSVHQEASPIEQAGSLLARKIIESLCGSAVQEASATPCAQAHAAVIGAANAAEEAILPLAALHCNNGVKMSA